MISYMKSKISSNYKKLLTLLALAVFLIYGYHLEKKPTTINVNINQHTVYAQVADTEIKRRLGLSYTKKLDKNAGMLFIFEEESQKNFWMRDMNYDLDIIWVDKDKNVVGFFENVSTTSYNHVQPELSKIYKSPNNTKYVLEVVSGTIEKVKIKVGDKLDFDY